MPPFRVAITDYQAPPPLLEERELAGLASVDCLLARHTDDLPGRVESYDALIVFHEISLPASLILTPHTAFYSEAAVEEIRIKASREVARVLRGEPPRNPVNDCWQPRPAARP